MMFMEKKSATAAQKKARTFRERLGSTLVMWAIVFAAFWSGLPWALALLIAALTIVACLEWVKLWGDEVDHACHFWMLVVAGVYLLWQGWRLQWGELVGFAPELMAVVSVLIGGMMFRLRREIHGKEAIFSVIVATFGLVYLALCFGGGLLHLASYPMNAGVGEFRHGLWLVLLVVIATKFTDMGAYLSGSLLGRNKMIPHISPAKTWEGFAGALVFCVGSVFGIKALAGDRLAFLPSGWDLAVFAVLIGLAAVIGDLAESLIKRSLEKKDSGAVLPGIGGMLDLLDSICFSAPAAYLFLTMTNHIQ